MEPFETMFIVIVNSLMNEAEIIDRATERIGGNSMFNFVCKGTMENPSYKVISSKATDSKVMTTIQRVVKGVFLNSTLKILYQKNKKWWAKKKQLREEFKKRYILEKEIGYFMIGRNQYLVRDHDFPQPAVDILDKQFSRYYININKKTTELILFSSFAFAGKPILNSKELFIPFMEEQKQEINYDKPLPQGICTIFEMISEMNTKFTIGFKKFLQLLAVFVNGSLKERIPTFIHCLDMNNNGHFLD